MIKVDNHLNNIFDQYDQEENRITNALLQTLAKNSNLLKAFLRTYFNICLGENTTVVISSQKEPFGIGDEESDRERAGGIPDGWIIIDEEKAIVFESKIVRDAIRRDQLLAHTKRIKGYSQKFLCVITPDEDSPVTSLNIPNVEMKWISWRDIYDLIRAEKDSQDLSGYLRNELKEYLAMKEDLVGFQGVDFTSGSFNPQEAKIIIKSLITEIKPEILKVYPNLKFEGRFIGQSLNPYAVSQRSTWSFLGVDKEFTKDMHITFWLTETHMGMGITVPDKATKRWGRLRQIFNKDDLFDSFMDKLYKLRSKLPNLYLEFVHRHYIIRKLDIIDGVLEMDLDTVKGSKKVKANEKWLEAIRELIKNKHDYNGQLMFKTRFFYKDSPAIKTEGFKDRVIKTVYKFKEIYDFLCLK